MAPDTPIRGEIDVKHSTLPAVSSLPEYYIERIIHYMTKKHIIIYYLILSIIAGFIYYIIKYAPQIHFLLIIFGSYFPIIILHTNIFGIILSIFIFKYRTQIVIGYILFIINFLINIYSDQHINIYNYLFNWQKSNEKNLNITSLAHSINYLIMNIISIIFIIGIYLFTKLLAKIYNLFMIKLYNNIFIKKYDERNKYIKLKYYLE
jgi:hypothetical protein